MIKSLRIKLIYRFIDVTCSQHEIKLNKHKEFIDELLYARVNPMKSVLWLNDVQFDISTQLAANEMARMKDCCYIEHFRNGESQSH